MSPRDVPAEVIAAARIIEKWARDNGIESWRIGALASRDELERTAARYAVARDLGTVVQAERWRGPVEVLVTHAEYDGVIDACIRERKSLSMGQIVDLSINTLKG